MADLELKRPTPPDLRRPARWIAACICILYGFAKINGSQFTVLDSELTRPMGEVRGFWLVWYFFGYSKAYGTLIACLEIGGGVLLTWPRTALLGSLVLLPVVVNIVLTDIFFGIGALPMSLLLLLCLFIVVVPDLPALTRAVIGSHTSSKNTGVLRTAGVALILAGAWR